MTELATPPTEQKQGLTRISHWIGGKTVAGTSGRTSPVYNPALGQQSGEVDLATVEEVGAAVAAAKAAFPAWRATSLAKRAELMFASASSCTSGARRSRGSSRPSTARCSPTRWARSRAGSR